MKKKPNLAIIQVTESSNHLLLVQLICLQLHTSHDLHCAVVLQTLITSQNHLSGRALIQQEEVTFLEKQIPMSQSAKYQSVFKTSLSILPLFQR